ncbi:18823_t:CDS:2 [Racocetra fulgida]|uniref:18823_t:CDS:1 n=1 Tax=Racocetra fulgida TaxID=60492 RepID=A0A9N9CMY9_9GLOM|nr:18823_t:CDS:2 [Racocetra fulgida]
MTIGLINALPMVPEIHVVAPGPGPWIVGSQQTITNVIAAVYKVGNDTPLIANNKPLNTGTSKFSISGPDWSLKSTYYTQICLISIPSSFCTNGTTFRITKRQYSTFKLNTIKNKEVDVEKRFIRRADPTTTSPAQGPSETGGSRTSNELPSIPSNWRGQISNQVENFFNNNERPPNNGPQNNGRPPNNGPQNNGRPQNNGP